MRYLIIALLALVSCQPVKPQIIKQVIHDTVYVPQVMPCDTLFYVHKIDSMDKRIDKYANALLKEKTRMEQVQKYIRIVLNNPSQIKFLRGWNNRALSL